LVMLYLDAKPSHMEPDVDELAYSLHHPTICGWQTRGLCCLTGAVLFHHSIVGGGPFLGVQSPWV
jgi:hypothetical protein